LFEISLSLVVTLLTGDVMNSVIITDKINVIAAHIEISEPIAIRVFL